MLVTFIALQDNGEATITVGIENIHCIEVGAKSKIMVRNPSADGEWLTWYYVSMHVAQEIQTLWKKWEKTKGNVLLPNRPRTSEKGDRNVRV